MPVHAWGTVCRGKCLDALHATTATETLVCPEATARRATPQGFRHFTDQLSGKEWIVSAKRSRAGPGHVLDSLSRYPHRVAIANQRIVDVQDGRVPFPSRTRRPGNRVQTMPLEAQEGIRRLLLHVLPQGVQRLRHVGVLAIRCKARALRQCRPLLDQPATPPTAEKTTVVQGLWQLPGTDSTRCPHCGHGPLPRIPLPALPLRPGHPSQPPTVDAS